MVQGLKKRKRKKRKKRINAPAIRVRQGYRL
jgi:hypothetical protein